MTKWIVALAAGLVVAMMLAGLLVLRGLLDQGQQSSQTCQFAEWENQQLWPQGGGPPLPPGC